MNKKGLIFALTPTFIIGLGLFLFLIVWSGGGIINLLTIDKTPIIILLAIIFLIVFSGRKRR